MADGVDLSALQKAGFSAGGGKGDAEAAEKRAAMEDARQGMLKSIMTPEAKQRLDRVALVRPENARAVEEHLIRLARGGKLAGQVDEDTLKKLLDDVGKFVEERNPSGVVKKVTIQRKKRADDEDSDLEGL